MAVVGLLSHPGRPSARGLEERTARWLERLGHRARRLGAAGAIGATEPSGDQGGAIERSEDERPEDEGSDGQRPGGRRSEGQRSDRDDGARGLDLLVSLGGDGTMLRTVRLAAPAGVPVLGVNLGRLGYLTAVEPDGLEHALERFLAGDYTLDTRMTLEVGRRRAGEGGGAGDRWLALNDAVLQRPGGGHTIRVAVAVNGRRFVAFAADALIVATPTGSTAYNLSARGPIVSPRARVQILTPVAPHGLFDRSLVLDADERVELTPEGDRAADLVIDGVASGTLCGGEVVEVSAGKDVHLVTFEERDFAEILTQKFSLEQA
ncbi:MAG: NAD(+)/NADH kinase [Actinomycetota bacterium]|nr:NAD(+)/NADH kinase [Actinomycetota bacterium]